MDGVFVPNISIGLPVVKAIRPTTALPLDVHLMIVQPGRYADQFCDAGADIVTMHVEADTEENIREAIQKVHAKGKRAGVVVKPGTSAQAVLPFIKDVEMILVMTVEPGFGGQSFMADQMPKVRAIREYINAQNPPELEVDGGVARVLPHLIDAGPMCCGGQRGVPRRRHSRPHPAAAGLRGQEMKNISDLPRLPLGCIHAVSQVGSVSKRYGGPVYIKRDDLCGMALAETKSQAGIPAGQAKPTE